MKKSVKNAVVCLMFGVLLAAAPIARLFIPNSGFSYSERRPLAKLPEVTAENIRTGSAMTAFDNWSTDNFPFRDLFRTIKATTSKYVFRRLDNNNIYMSDGYAAAIEYPLDEASLAYAASRFRSIYDAFLKNSNANVYLSVIPDKGAFLAERGGVPSMDYGAFEALMEEETCDFAEYIRISDLLELSDYYKTDTHWRQERITDVAQRLAASMGTTVSDSGFTVNELESGFRGVYYGQSALPLPAEPMYYLTNAAIDGCVVRNGEKNNAVMDMYDMALAEGYDPYEMYLSGSLSLVTIENPNASSGKELVLFRDSFGSSVAPLLAEGYRKITLVDIRYLQPMFLDRFVDFENADVLFLYSTLVLNHSETIK